MNNYTNDSGEKFAPLLGEVRRDEDIPLHLTAAIYRQIRHMRDRVPGLKHGEALRLAVADLQQRPASRYASDADYEELERPLMASLCSALQIVEDRRRRAVVVFGAILHATADDHAQAARVAHLN